MWRQATIFIALVASVVALGQPASTYAEDFVVTSTADSGPGSLRAAIESANTNGNPGARDRITFDLDPGLQTITLNSQLPLVSQPLEIDGESQDGASCAAPRSLLIEIDGNGQQGVFVNHGGATGTIIRGLTLRNFGGTALAFLDGSQHLVECMHIGTNAAGTAASANDSGVLVVGPASGVDIGGTDPAQRNVISGNAQVGLTINGATDVDVYGNHIGVSLDGTAGIANGAGISVQGGASDIDLGGTDAGQGNVISGNDSNSSSYGAWIFGASNLRIQGNIIGLNAAGTAAVPNADAGIRVGNGTAISQIFIGGSEAGRNVISGNGGHGIHVLRDAPGVSISYNYIGTNAAGTTAIGNDEDGVRVAGSANVSVGGSNVISGNGGAGVMVVPGIGVETEAIQIEGNIIGYAADGTTPMPNTGESAILLFTGTTEVSQVTNNTILAFRPGAPIANGVYIGGGERISVSSNDIVSEGHAINLHDGAVGEGPNVSTPNDGAPDDDTGPNGLQNWPVLTGAQAGNEQRVQGTLDSAPDQNYVIQFFRNASCDEDTHRPAEHFLASSLIGADESGHAVFDVPLLQGGFAAGDIITATVRDPQSNTSEVSNCIVATGSALSINKLSPDERVAGSTGFELTVTGAGFTNDSVVRWNGTPLPTVFDSPTQLRATVSAAVLGNAKASVVVDVSAPGPVDSNDLTFLVTRSSSDVNCDGVVTAEDVQHALDVLVGLEDDDPGCSANASQEGLVGIEDPIWIRREIAGLIPNPLKSFYP